MRQRQLNILILYVANRYPMRTTLWDQLYSFRRYSDHNCFYLNLTVRQLPWYLKKIKFDLIVFGTLFMASRVDDKWFDPPREKARGLNSFAAAKIAFPQDEYLCTDVLSDFINEFGIDCVFSVAPESEWPKIYEGIDTTKVKIFSVLTGYLDPATLARINLLTKEGLPRDIDVGYRTWRAAPNLGRHGFLRQKIADLFKEKAPGWGLVTDISTRREDTLWGDAWYKFLLRCKYVTSVEGGASLLDRDGTIQRQTEEYLARHPDATFDEVERACFPGLDGNLRYVALSPRHLEACATRTCQVLVEGEYNGILKPGRHYIELKRDFSNADQVLEIIKQDQLRSEITRRAYRDIVESRHYTYRSYVDFVLEKSVPHLPNLPATALSSFSNALFYYWMRASDFISWIQVALSLYAFRARAKGKLRRLLAAVFSEQSVASTLGRLRQSGKR